MARKGNPWIRFDVQTYMDAKVRLGRCGAVWPWVLTTLKRCGGSVTDEDLEPVLCAADLCIEVEQVEAQLAGAKRVGLLVRSGDEWVTPGWDTYQPDPRARWDKRPGDAASAPIGPRDGAGVPREQGGGPKASRSYTTDGTGRDETGRDTPPGPPPVSGTPSGAREGDGIDGDTLTRWRQAVGAGVILTNRQELALTTAWETYGATVTREAVAAALDWSVQAHGRTFRPEWLDGRCAKLRAAKVREDANAEPPRGVQPVLDAFNSNRDHPLTAHQRGQVIEAIKGETPSTLAALAVQVGGAGPVRVPASWLAAVLPETRAKAAAEDAARERYAEADRQRAQEAEAFRRKMEDPAFRAERAIGAAKLKAALAEMGGDE